MRLDHQKEIQHILPAFDADHSGIYVEVAEISIHTLGNEFRRRMRFEYIPNFYQADCVLSKRDGISPLVWTLKTLTECYPGDHSMFTVNLQKLTMDIQAMLFGIQTIQMHLAYKFEMTDDQMEVLSLGSGVAILERVFKPKFNARVLGVEKDPNLQGFGATCFNSSISNEREGVNKVYGFDAFNVIAELGNEVAMPQDSNLVEACAPYKGRMYDLILMDMIDFDDLPMAGACAPPRCFIAEPAFHNIKRLLQQFGAQIIHVITPDSFFEINLENILKSCFAMVYKINLGRDFEYVLVATDSFRITNVIVKKDDHISSTINSLVTGSFILSKI